MISQPGCSFDYIWNLIQKNGAFIAPTPFTPELIAAIFWEESMFNNVAQVGSGTAVGFGQVEPAEFYRFNARNLNSPSPAMKSLAQQVQKKGYLVYNLPPVVKNGSQKTLNGALTDEQAVQVAMALVRDLHERGRSRKGILAGYAGIGFTGPQADHLKGDGRQKVVDGWLRCEAKLLACSKSDPDAVMMALQEAKPFNQWLEFRKILFPNAAPSSKVPTNLPGQNAGAVVQSVAQAVAKMAAQAAGSAQQAYRASTSPQSRNSTVSGWNVVTGKCY